MGLTTIVSRGFAALVVAVAAALPTGTVDAANSDQTDIELPGSRILALSPDGQLLAARTPEDGRPDQLCVYDVAAQAQHACGNLSEHDLSMTDDSVIWSPDSTQIAFSEDALRTFVDGDLWVMDVATGELTNLTDDGFEGPFLTLGGDQKPPDGPIYVDILPAWSPDSTSIAFSRSPFIAGESRGNEVARVDVASGEVTSLAPVTSDTPGVVYWGLAWAPDGQRLYYSVALPDLDDTHNGVWEYDVATGEATQLLRNDPEKGPPALLRVSATGRTGLVAYPVHMAEVFGSGDFLALLDLESEEVSPVNPADVDPSSPVLAPVATFSPDGTRLLYGLDRLEDESGRLVVRELPHGQPDSQPEEVVPGFDSRPFMATMGGGLFWATDGTVFVATDVGSGVVLQLEPGEVPLSNSKE